MMRKGFIFGVWVFIFAFYFMYTSVSAQNQTFIKQMKTPEGVSYMTGGVGKDERDNLSKLAKEYNLKLVFSVSKGPYLANVEVQIKDSTGKKVIETTSDGPWFFVQLPSGNYNVTAKAMGKSISQKADVPEKGQAVVNFFWKE